MWFIGLVIGALLGTFASEIIQISGLWMLSAALGAIVGIFFKIKLNAGRPPSDDQEDIKNLYRRLSLLEQDVARLTWKMKTGYPGEQSWAETGVPITKAEPRLAFECNAPAESTPRVAAVAEQSIASSTAPEIYPAITALIDWSWLWRKLFSGNILAKIGVVIVFFGVASGLKLAISFGMFPPSVRLLVATIAGLAMIGIGLWWRADETHRNFTLSLQGGGFALLYLVTYFALSWYHLIEPTPAFVLFGIIGFSCVAAAIYVEGEVLAILGISGAFLAAILASTGKGSYVMLFSFYVLLDIMALTVNWVKIWRSLGATALMFTLGVGMMWAERNFVPEYFASVELFVVAFSVMFSANTVLLAIVRRIRLAHWAEIVMVFGTPVASAICQTWLMRESGYSDIALAWAALAAGLYYCVLLAALRFTGSDIQMQRAHLAIAIPFITVAIPLAFGAEVTTAFWAVEGVALIWMGIENQSRVAVAFGYPLQVMAGIYFRIHLHSIDHLMPVLNGAYVGCLTVTLCGAASAWITFKRRSCGIFDADILASLAGLAMAWAILWWVAGAFREINDFVPEFNAGALQVGTLLAVAWLLEAAGVQLTAILPRISGLFAAGIALLWVPAESWSGLFGSGTGDGHPLHDGMIFATPLAFASLYGLMRRLERDGQQSATIPAHLYALWMLAFALALEGVWIARELAYFTDLWQLLAWGVLPVCVALVSTFFVEKKLWPAKAQPKLYLNTGIPILLAAMLLWAVYANFTHDGGGSDLPYMPVLSFFDLAQMLLFYSAIHWLRIARGVVSDTALRSWRSAVGASAFIWLSAMAMRIAHHWGGVPFEAYALLNSGMAQSLLSILWTSLAIAIMISATQSANRARWFAGFGLLGIVGAKFLVVDVVNRDTITWAASLIGVGLLILAASYFSPAPPKSADATA